MTIKTTIADILSVADALSVLTDKLEEVGTEARLLVEKHARLAGDTYETAGLMLEEGGHTLNAREAFDKARSHYMRANDVGNAHRATDRVIRNRPASGNIYGFED